MHHRRHGGHLAGQGDAVVEVALSQPLPSGTPVSLGLRPEHALVGVPGPGSFVMMVDVVEYLGATSYLYAGTTTSEPLIVARQGVHTDRVGDQVDVGIPPDKAILFAADGTRLR